MWPRTKSIDFSIRSTGIKGFEVGIIGLMVQKLRGFVNGKFGVAKFDFKNEGGRNLRPVYRILVSQIVIPT